jgi:hypothetical protein
VSYSDINLFGIYVAPIVPMLLGAWVVLVPLRWAADRAGLLRHAWHPALFVFSVYVMLVSAIVLCAGGWGV